MCKTIHHKVKFKAPPNEIYNLLAKSDLHTKLSEHKAVIGKKAGDKFTTYSGYVRGITVDLEPGKRIVQAWRSKDFPKGIFSMATFVFKNTKDGGTELDLTHRGVPKTLIPAIEKFWRERYWARIKIYLMS